MRSKHEPDKAFSICNAYNLAISPLVKLWFDGRYTHQAVNDLFVIPSSASSAVYAIFFVFISRPSLYPDPVICSAPVMFHASLFPCVLGVCGNER